MNQLQKKILFFGVLSGIGLTFISRRLKKILYCRFQLEILKNEFSPNQLKKLINEKDKKIKEIIKYDNKQVRSDKIMITGIINCENPLYSQYNQNAKLIFKLNQKQNKYVNQEYIPEQYLSYDEQYIHYSNIKDKIQLIDFQLDDIEKKDEICQIQAKNSKIRFIDKIDKFYNKFTSIETSIIEKFNINLSKLIFGFLTVFGIKGATGCTIGYEEKELGLQLGGLASIIGQVVYNFEDNSLKIINPYVILENTQIYKKYLKENIRFNVFFIAMITVATFYSISQLKQYYDKYKQILHKQQISVENQRNNLFTMNKCFKDIQELKCMVCLDQTRSVIVKPCMHLAQCLNCYDQLIKQECIVCRNVNNGSVDVLVSQ